jgi:uracil-DNA glycosylase family 4
MARLFPDNTFVAPSYPTGRDLVRLVIAEAPGAEEAINGRPLVGGSGRIFDKLLSKVGINRDGLTIANCIQCQPPDNVFPTDAAARKYISKEEGVAAVAHCRRAHLGPLLDSRDWVRVDLLGDKPLRLVAGRNGGVSNLRGSSLVIDRPDKTSVRGLATFHPAYLMRDQSMLPVAANDLVKSLDVEPEFYEPFPSIDVVRKFISTTFAFDIECPKYRFLGENAPAEMVGLSDRANHAICVPVRGEYLVELRRIFSAAKKVIGHNCIQFDLPKLRILDIKTSVECVVDDTMLLQHLVFPDFPHDLEFVGSQFVNKPAWKSDKGVLETYCCRDTDVTFQSWQQLLPMVRKEKLLDLYNNVQVPMAKICSLLHETGFKVDGGRIGLVREKLLAQLESEEKELPDWLRTHEQPTNKRVPAPAGTLGKSGKPVKFIQVASTERVVPWRSPATKGRYLYTTGEGCLGFEPILDPKSGNVTTGKVALDKLYSRSKIRAIRALRVLNQIDETLSTFAKADMVKISRMYPHFNVHGTASGRLSSSDPNLQNIPETARVIYVPSHVDWKIVDVDYSQIENRLTAYFAGDEERLARFSRDATFSEHKYAASLFLNIPYEDVVKDNDKDAPYGKAKRIVHGTNYGMGYRKIANLYDMDPRETKRLQDLWKAAIAPTSKWQEACGRKAHDDGVLTTPFGRKRYFWTSSYYTEALSFLPQSTAADVLFRAMIALMYERIGLAESDVKKIVRIYEPLPEPARILITVHDSLVLEAPTELIPEVVRIVKKVMEQPFEELGGMTIPISVAVGDSWGETNAYRWDRRAA